MGKRKYLDIHNSLESVKVKGPFFQYEYSTDGKFAVISCSLKTIYSKHGSCISVISRICPGPFTTKQEEF